MYSCRCCTSSSGMHGRRVGKRVLYLHTKHCHTLRHATTHCGTRPAAVDATTPGKRVRYLQAKLNVIHFGTLQQTAARCTPLLTQYIYMNIYMYIYVYMYM